MDTTSPTPTPAPAPAKKPQGPPPDLHGSEPEMMFYALRVEQLAQRLVSLVAKLRHPTVDAEKANEIRDQMKETLERMCSIEALAHDVVHSACAPVIYCEDLFISTETSKAIRKYVGNMPLRMLRSGNVRFTRMGLTELQMIEIRAAAKRVCKEFDLTIKDSL